MYSFCWARWHATTLRLYCQPCFCWGSHGQNMLGPDSCEKLRDEWWEGELVTRAGNLFAVERVMKNNFKWKLTSKYSHVGTILGTTVELNQVERWILMDHTNILTTARQRHWIGSQAPSQGFFHQFSFGGKGGQERADENWPATDRELFFSQPHIAAVWKERRNSTTQHRIWVITSIKESDPIIPLRSACNGKWDLFHL